MLGEEVRDDSAVPVDGLPGAEGEFRRLEEGRFFARLRLPVSGLWESPGTPVGLALKVGLHEACIPEAWSWLGLEGREIPR